MARALARGWGEPRAVRPMRGPGRAQALAEEVGGEALRVQRRASPQRGRPRRALPQAAPARGVAAEIARRTPGGRLGPRRRRRWPTLQGRLPGPPGRTASCRHAGRGAPGRRRPRRRRRAGRRGSTPRCARCSARSARSSSVAEALVDVATGADEHAPAYVRAGRRGAGRRRRPPRAAARPGRRARGPDDGRHRRAAARARRRHARRAPRGHLAGRITARGLAALERAGVRGRVPRRARRGARR